MKKLSLSHPQRVFLLAALLLGSCDDREASSSRPLALAPESAVPRPAQKPSAMDASQHATFPRMPTADRVTSLAVAPALSQKTDLQLKAHFEAAKGHAWNQSLMEMGKRRTPELIAVMARHLDEVKGFAVQSGEALYAPELRYPVALELMHCGDLASADLVKIGSSDGVSLKQRVLAVRVLMQINPQADLGQLEAHASSESERRLLREAHKIAANDEQTLAMFGGP